MAEEIIDLRKSKLLSTLPSYIALALNLPSYAMSIRLLRLLRIFRILKLACYLECHAHLNRITLILRV
jgi:hypothetical protein